MCTVIYLVYCLGPAIFCGILENCDALRQIDLHVAKHWRFQLRDTEARDPP